MPNDLFLNCIDIAEGWNDGKDQGIVLRARTGPCAQRCLDRSSGHGHGSRAGIPIQGHASGGRLSARRRQRHHRARHRQKAWRVMGATGSCRKPAGRKRNHRHGLRRQIGPRWLHAGTCEPEPSGLRPFDLRKDSLRHHQGLHPHHAGCDGAYGNRGASILAGALAEGPYRACPVPTRKAEFRVVR